MRGQTCRVESCLAFEADMQPSTFSALVSPPSPRQLAFCCVAQTRLTDSEPHDGEFVNRPQGRGSANGGPVRQARHEANQHDKRGDEPQHRRLIGDIGGDGRRKRVVRMHWCIGGHGGQAEAQRAHTRMGRKKKKTARVAKMTMETKERREIERKRPVVSGSSASERSMLGANRNHTMHLLAIAHLFELQNQRKKGEQTKRSHR